jgi:hypothetical protein
MSVSTGAANAEDQMQNLLRSLSGEIRKGIVEGAIILALGLGLLGWSLAVRSPGPAALGPTAAFWSSFPVVVLGISYFVRSYADSQVRREVQSIKHALAVERTASSADQT